MPTGNQATNAFGNIIQFYADQAEKINPVITGLYPKVSFF